METNKLRYVDYIGVESATTYLSNPYFFLFADIDTKDKEKLRQAISVFAERQLHFCWYGTNKGYHIISFSLMNLKEWDSARRELSKVLHNYYQGLVIRIQAKQNDSSVACHQNLDFAEKHKVSASMVSLIEKRFHTSIKIHKSRLVKTKLLFTHYAQLELL